MNKLTPQEKEIYKTFFDDNEGSGSSRWLVSPDTVERFISQIKSNIIEKAKKCTRGLCSKGCEICEADPNIISKL